jgi:DedD protein
LQDHLKERLTGAAILVVVVVLLVPELFRGPPDANSKAGNGAAAGPPLRSYTIDLRDTATAQPPGAGTNVVASAPASGANPPASTPATVVTSGEAAASATPPATPVAEAAQPSPPPATTAAPAPKTPAHPAPSPHAGAAKSGWTVQVGSFARRDYAERMAKQVSAKGFTVEVAGPDDRGLFRVRSAVQPERAAAMALKQKMQASGLKPIVNTAP